jgi:hypothetical protein
MTVTSEDREVEDGSKEEAEAGGAEPERESRQDEEEEDVARQVIVAAPGRSGRSAVRVR